MGFYVLLVSNFRVSRLSASRNCIFVTARFACAFGPVFLDVLLIMCMVMLAVTNRVAFRVDGRGDVVPYCAASVRVQTRCAPKEPTTKELAALGMAP